MITAAPSASFEATAQGYATGLVGTIAVRVVDGQGSTVVARRTTGIVEHPAGSGIYTATLTAPAIPGQYLIAFDNGGSSSSSWATEDLIVTSVPTGSTIVDGTAPVSMVEIISRCRRMIDDVDADSPEFNDSEIADALNKRSTEARYYPLTERQSIAPGGAVTWLTFDAPVGDWASDVVLTDSSYNVLTPITSDLVMGRWTFATQPHLPVFILGITYDLYGAAGDLLLQWATRESCAFDVSADGLTLARSQKAEMRRQRATEYHAKSRTTSASLVRTDESC